LLWPTLAVLEAMVDMADMVDMVVDMEEVMEDLVMEVMVQDLVMEVSAVMD
jgi:hypothetical protein